MSAVLKPTGLSPEERARIDQACVEAERAHLMREDVCQTVPMVPRGRNVKKRPKTAIVSRLMQRAFEQRMARERLFDLTAKLYGKPK